MSLAQYLRRGRPLSEQPRVIRRDPPPNPYPHEQRIIGWNPLGPKSILKHPIEPLIVTPIVAYKGAVNETAKNHFGRAFNAITDSEARQSKWTAEGKPGAPPVTDAQTKYILWAYGKKTVESLRYTYRFEDESDFVCLINSRPQPFWDHWRSCRIQEGDEYCTQDRLNTGIGYPRLASAREPVKPPKTDLELQFEACQKISEERFVRELRASRKRKFEELHSEPEDNSLRPTGDEDCYSIFDNNRLPGAWSTEDDDDERDPTAEEYITAASRKPPTCFQDSARRERNLLAKAVERIERRKASSRNVATALANGVFGVASLGFWGNKQAARERVHERKVDVIETTRFARGVFGSVKRRYCETSRRYAIRGREFSNVLRRNYRVVRDAANPIIVGVSNVFNSVFATGNAQRARARAEAAHLDIVRAERSRLGTSQPPVTEADITSWYQQHPNSSTAPRDVVEDLIRARLSTELSENDVLELEELLDEPLPPVPTDEELQREYALFTQHNTFYSADHTNVDRANIDLNGQDQRGNCPPAPISIPNTTISLHAVPNAAPNTTLATAGTAPAATMETPSVIQQLRGAAYNWLSPAVNYFWTAPSNSPTQVQEPVLTGTRRNIQRATDEARAKRARREQKSAARKLAARIERPAIDDATEMDWEATDADSSSYGSEDDQASSRSSSDDELAGPNRPVVVQQFHGDAASSDPRLKREYESIKTLSDAFRYMKHDETEIESTDEGTSSGQAQQSTPFPSMTGTQGIPAGHKPIFIASQASLFARRQPPRRQPPRMVPVLIPPPRRVEVSESRKQRRIKEQQEQEAKARWLAEEAARKTREEEERLKKEAEAVARKAREEAEAKAKRQGVLVAPTRPPIPALPRVWRQKLNEAMSTTDRTKVLAESPKKTNITRHSFGTCVPKPGTADSESGWLNDEIIMSYLEHIAAYGNGQTEDNPRPKQSLADKKDVPRYVVFNSNFYNSLASKGPKQVERWPGRQGVAGDKLLKAEIVFVPINKGAHWTMAAIRPQVKRVEYYDSMGTSPGAVFGTISKFLGHHLKDLYDEATWTFKMPRTPQQNNGSDCGVFAVTAAQMLTLGLDPMQSYGAQDMRCQRERILAVLLNGGFTGPHFVPEDPLAAGMHTG